MSRDGHVRFGCCYFAPCVFYRILLVLLRNFRVIPFVSVGKYGISTILTLFLASGRFGCVYFPFESLATQVCYSLRAA